MSNLRLRALEPEDLDILYHIENDRSLWNVGTTNVPYSRYALHGYIATASSDIYADRQLRLMVEKTADDGKVDIVGIVDLMDFSPSHLRAEVGIVIVDACRRRGYATEVLGMVEEYCRRVIHLHQLYAIVAADNEAASRLFKKCGYREQSRLKDWLFDGENYAEAVVMQKIL